MFFERKGLRVFVYRDEIDMRCGFERLHSYCIHLRAHLMYTQAMQPLITTAHVDHFSIYKDSETPRIKQHLESLH